MPSIARRQPLAMKINDQEVATNSRAKHLITPESRLSQKLGFRDGVNEFVVTPVTETRSGRDFWQQRETHPAGESPGLWESQKARTFGDSRLQIGIPREWFARCLLAPFE